MGVVKEDVTFSGPGGREQRAHLARPEPDGVTHAGVLVLHELFGLNNDTRRIAARFAEEGYVALAPDFFDTPGVRPVLCIVRAIRSLRAQEGPVFELLAHAHEHLAGLDDVDPERIGAVGFCMGGGFAVLHAVQQPVAVVAVQYGDVPKRAASLQGICPVVAGYGGRDRVFAPFATRLKGHLEELGVDNDIKVYPNAGHSYMSRHKGLVARASALGPMKVGYNHSAAEDSWTRIFAFFEKHLTAHSPSAPSV